jgi:tetratricopeptide (TPR) repeat protein
MSGHPNREALQGFLLGLLPASESQEIASHLLKGCPPCQEEMTMISSVLFDDESDSEVDLSDDLEEAYDRAITAAIAGAMRTLEGLTHQRSRSATQVEDLVAEAFAGRDLSIEGPITVGLCETLIDRSFELRESDPQAMLRLARCAQEATDRLERKIYPQGLTFDLRARAWANLANALRLNEDLESAQKAMKRASQLRTEGTGDPLLQARLADLAASLQFSLRRFPEALQLLDVAIEIHRRHSGPHEIGRILILKGIYIGASGDAVTGLQLLAQSLRLVDRERDPRLAFSALHSILFLRTELGEFEAAAHQLRQMQPLYDRRAGAVLRLKLLGLEGEIAAGLGDLDRAEATLRKSRAACDEAKLGYLASLHSLSLAVVLLRQGKTAEVRDLVLAAVAAFQGLGLEPDAAAAAQVLREAQEHDQATVEVLQLAGRIFRRLQNASPHSGELL